MFHFFHQRIFKSPPPPKLTNFRQRLKRLPRTQRQHAQQVTSPVRTGSGTGPPRRTLQGYEPSAPRVEISSTVFGVRGVRALVPRGNPVSTSSQIGTTCGKASEAVLRKRGSSESGEGWPAPRTPVCIIKSFCKSQLSRKSVNLLFLVMIIQNQLTHLWRT